MSESENKLAERRLKELVWDRHDPDAANEFIHPDVVEHNSILGASHGREGYKRAMAMAFSAFPDAELVHDDLIGEGDKLVERWTIRGTHLGEFMGIAATKRRIELHGVDIYRYADGKRVESWSFFDRLDLLRQLGAGPTAG